jgi:hypothetical protein
VGLVPPFGMAYVTHEYYVDVRCGVEHSVTYGTETHTGDTLMANRVYAPKIVPPEIARESPLSRARFYVMNVRRNLALRESALAAVIKRGEMPDIGVTIAKAEAAIAAARADLERVIAHLASVEAA